MRTNHIWGVAVVALLLVGGVAAWNLRRPILEGIDFIRGKSGHADLRFAVVGDNHGDNPIYREILETIEADDYEFLLNVADTSEFGKPEEFAAVKTLESKLPFPVYHTVGNHDIKADPTRAAFASAFHHGPNTLVTHGDIRLLILDNADRKVGFSEETTAWLEEQLAASPNAKFILAYHRPFELPLASVAGDDETSASRRTNNKVLALIRKYNVIQIFTGHIHTYIPYNVQGIPAVVTGGGGDPAQSAIGGAKNNLFHYLEVEVRGNRADIGVHAVRIQD